MRGLYDSKLRAIKTFLCSKYDIITLAETFLSARSKTNSSLQDFHPIMRKDRQVFGGGVAIFVKKDVYQMRFDLNFWQLCNPPNFNEF